jgi:hypothetical protein
MRIIKGEALKALRAWGPVYRVASSSKESRGEGVASHLNDAGGLISR